MTERVLWREVSPGWVGSLQSKEGRTVLVLTRKRDESIIIGDDIRVTVVDVRGDQVKLGIEAPRSIPVHREEIYKEIQAENRRAALQGNVNTSKLEDLFGEKRQE